MQNYKSTTFFESLRNALAGILNLFIESRNARIELSIALLVVICGFYFHITLSEWSILLITIGIVLSAEGLNTALENLSDKLHPDFDDKIGKAKDIAAGSVLILSFVAAIEGIIIFAPYFVNLFTK